MNAPWLIFITVEDKEQILSVLSLLSISRTKTQRKVIGRRPVSRFRSDLQNV